MNINRKLKKPEQSTKIKCSGSLQKKKDGCADSQTNITAQPAEMKWAK